MGPAHVLETTPHHFGERYLPLFGDLFRPLIKLVGDLNLSFYHDGKMPSSARLVKRAVVVDESVGHALRLKALPLLSSPVRKSHWIEIR